MIHRVFRQNPTDFYNLKKARSPSRDIPAMTMNCHYPVMVVGHILFENVIADVVFYDFLIYPVCVVRFLSFPFRRRSRLSL